MHYSVDERSPHPIVMLLHLPRVFRCIVLLAALAGAGGCGIATGPRERTLTIEVAENFVSCMSWVETTCLQIREHANDPWQAFSDHIEGFEYVPGFRYMLRVRKREIPNPPADGSSVAWRLVAVLAKSPMP